MALRSTRPDNTPPIAQRLRQLREELGISQKQLGILAGIDEFSASPRINQYEQGKHVPDFATLKRLAAVLEVPVTYLYADDDELAELIRGFSAANRRVRAEIKKLLK